MLISPRKTMDGLVLVIIKALSSDTVDTGYIFSTDMDISNNLKVFLSKTGRICQPCTSVPSIKGTIAKVTIQAV